MTSFTTVKRKKVLISATLRIFAAQFFADFFTEVRTEERWESNHEVSNVAVKV